MILCGIVGYIGCNTLFTSRCNGRSSAIAIWFFLKTSKKALARSIAFPSNTEGTGTVDSFMAGRVTTAFTTHDILFISQDGVRSILGPGDFTLYDSTRPFNRYFDERVRIFVLRFPQNMISLPSHTMRSITAMRLGADEGIGVVVSPFMKNIADNMDELNGWAGTRVMHSLIDLVGASLAEKLFIEDAERGGARAQGFLRICDYIMDNLSDPGLSPDSIAAGTFISTRQLHKLFHAERVTVSKWVRDRRLEACRRQLADPGDSRLSVSDIAASWGIFDAAHFSRIFKQAYGQSPREYRRDHKLSA